jgi:hypothetical protein
MGTRSWVDRRLSVASRNCLLAGVQAPQVESVIQVPPPIASLEERS